MSDEEIESGFGEATEERAQKVEVQAVADQAEEKTHVSSSTEPLLPGAGETPTTEPLPFDGEEASATAAPKPKELTLAEQVKLIEENDNPDKFGQRVKLYQEATLKFNGGKDLSVEQFLAYEKDPRANKELEPRFTELKGYVAEIFTQYEKSFTDQIKDIPAEESSAAAAELLSQFTGKAITAEQLTGFFENGQIRDPAVFQQFLSQETSTSQMVEKFAQMHDLMNLQVKERVAVRKEISRQKEMITGDVTKTEEEKKSLLEQFEEFTAPLEKAFDKADVPSLINTLFAIEHGYGSYGRFDAMHNGLEKKQDLAEQKTLAALKQAFADKEKRAIFFREVLEIDSDKEPTYDVLQPKLKALLETDSNASEEDKKKKNLEVKQHVFAGFSKLEKKGFLSSIHSPDDINLSANVIKSLVLEVEKLK